MNRRGFLGSIIAVASAPAIVRASSLMPGRVWTPPTFKVTERIGAGFFDSRYLSETFIAESKLLSREELMRALLPGLNAAFSAEYDKYELKGLK